jgi:hypothetical protein
MIRRPPSGEAQQLAAITAAGFTAGVYGARTTLIGLAALLLASIVLPRWRTWTTRPDHPSANGGAFRAADHDRRERGSR